MVDFKTKSQTKNQIYQNFFVSPDILNIFVCANDPSPAVKGLNNNSDLNLSDIDQDRIVNHNFTTNKTK